MDDFTSEAELEEALATPSAALIEDFTRGRQDGADARYARTSRAQRGWARS